MQNQNNKEADADYEAGLRSASGLAGGDGAKLEAFRGKENRLIGDFLTVLISFWNSEENMKWYPFTMPDGCMLLIVSPDDICRVLWAVIVSRLKFRSTLIDPDSSIIR